MLTKHMRDDDRLAPVLEKITQQTFRASEIVNGLLNFSRTSGAEFTNIDLNHLLNDSLTLLEHQMKTSQIRVVTDLDPRLNPIYGNQGKLQVVTINPTGDTPYLAAYQNNDTSFSPGGALPGTTMYSSIAAGVGYSSDFTLIGADASYGYLYVAESQNTSGTWSAGGELPGPGGSQSIGFSSPLIANGAGGLQVGGLGHDGLLHMVAYQSSSNGSWTAFGSIPTTDPSTGASFSQLIWTPAPSSSLDILGLDTNSHIVLTTSQNSGGNWSAGEDLTPSGP